MIEGKSLREVNYVSVGISAAAGVTGAGLGKAVATVSRSITQSAVKQVAFRSAGNAVAGAGIGAAQTAATNLTKPENEKGSVLRGALTGAAMGGAGSLAGDAAEAVINKASTAIPNAITKAAGQEDNLVNHWREADC